MSEPFFDSQRLMDSVEQDVELALELLAAYVEDAPERMDMLMQGVEQDEIDQVVRAAHSLKGMSGVVRAYGLAEQALAMEMTARDNDMDEVRRTLPAFQASLDKVLDELRAFMDTLG